MSSRYTLILCGLLAVFSLSACQQRLYFPDRANTPGLTEALEAKGTLSFKPQTRESDSAGRLRGSSGSVAADLAFAPIKNLGIIASYRSLSRRFINDNDDIFADSYGGEFSGSRIEVGAGVWNTIGRRGKFELYAGYGNGSLKRRGESAFYKDFDTRYHRFFLQPALGVGNDVFQMTGGLRLAFHKYYDFSSSDPTLRYNIMQGSNGGVDVEDELTGFIEPFVNMEVGYQYVKFNMQFGFSAQYVGLNVAGTLPAYASFGVTFALAPRFFSNAPSDKSNMRDRRR